jgi:hypothetical protein
MWILVIEMNYKIRVIVQRIKKQMFLILASLLNKFNKEVGE